MVQSLTFYLFSSMVLLSGVMVIASRNPVHSVLFLILAFFSSSGLFILLGAEFLAMVLVIVYVGAVAVLFMFVVMMLDINFVEMRQGFLQYLPIGGLIGAVLLIELISIINYWSLPKENTLISKLKIFPAVEKANTNALGEVLYTKYIFLFQASGMILLLAMIGAIILTHRKRTGVKKQDINQQIARRADETIKLKKVQTGKGI